MKIWFQNVFIILNLVHIITCQSVPSSRYEQTGTLVGTKFYFFGGWISATRSTNEVWYIDLSIQNFSTSSPLWHKDAGMPIGYDSGSSCLSPIDNSSVFLIGGRTFVPNTSTFSTFNTATPVYVFNTTTSQWSTPTIASFNSSFIFRKAMTAIVDNDGKIFIYGGSFDDPTNASHTTFYNDLNILDITGRSWSTQPQPSYVETIVDYSATLLPNGYIVYIGGRNGISSSVSMNKISVFDTKANIWYSKTADGDNVGSRSGHSAILTNDGNIVLYGGSLMTNSGSINVLSDVVVLDTNSWAWDIPPIPKANIPPPLTYHSATLYKTYIIVAFGLISSTPTITLNNNIYILDTSNSSYNWVTAINTPTPIPSATPSVANVQTPPPPPPVLYIGIGIGVGGIILFALLFTVIILLCKKHNELNAAVPTPGDTPELTEPTPSGVFNESIKRDDPTPEIV